MITYFKYPAAPGLPPNPCKAYSVTMQLSGPPALAAFARAVLLHGIPTKRLQLLESSFSQQDILEGMLRYQVSNLTLHQSAPLGQIFTLQLENSSATNMRLTPLGSGLEPYVFPAASLACVHDGHSASVRVQVVSSTGHKSANFNACYAVSILAVDAPSDYKGDPLASEPTVHQLVARTNGDRPPSTLLDEFRVAALALLQAASEAATTAPFVRFRSLRSELPDLGALCFSASDFMYQTLGLVLDRALALAPDLSVAHLSEREDGFFHFQTSLSDEAELRALFKSATGAAIDSLEQFNSF